MFYGHRIILLHFLSLGRSLAVAASMALAIGAHTADAVVIPYLPPLPEPVLVDLKLIQTQSQYTPSDVSPIEKAKSQTQLTANSVQATPGSKEEDSEVVHCFRERTGGSEGQYCPLQSRFQVLVVKENDKGELEIRRSRFKQKDEDILLMQDAPSVSSLDRSRLERIGGEQLSLSQKERDEALADLKRISGAQIHFDRELDDLFQSLGIDEKQLRESMQDLEGKSGSDPDFSTLALIQAHFERKLGVGVATSSLIVELMGITRRRN